MTSSLGTMGKTKTSLLGVKNYRIELKLFTLVEDRQLYNIYSVFFFENFGFCDHFSKKVTFWNLCGQKSKIWKIRDSHFVDLAFLCIIHFLFAFDSKTIFGEFSNIYLLSAQNRVKWRHKIRPIAKKIRPILIFFARDVAKLMPGEVCQVSCRYSNKWSYSGKTEGGSDPTPPPPGGGGLKGLSHLVQSCLLRVYQNCTYVKRFRTFHWSCWSFFSKHCVACKKSTLKIKINYCFVTSFENSHYILLFGYIYGAQLIQWFCYSKHLHVNCRSYQWISEVLQHHSLLSAILLTSLSIFAQLWYQIFFNEDTAGVLGNT